MPDLPAIPGDTEPTEPERRTLHLALSSDELLDKPGDADRRHWRRPAASRPPDDGARTRTQIPGPELTAFCTWIENEPLRRPGKHHAD
jgi:hypothetical protein